MVRIETIFLRIITADIEHGDLDSGNVYLGIGGREFRIESDILEEGVPGENDWERGAQWDYILGKDAGQFVDPNDPPNPPKKMRVHNRIEGDQNSILEHYPLDTELLVGPTANNFYRFPVYIRLESSGTWALQFAQCLACYGPIPQPPQVQQYLHYSTIMEAGDYIWLGPQMGKICYLRAHQMSDTPT
jgi:hypothetical protein